MGKWRGGRVARWRSGCRGGRVFEPATRDQFNESKAAGVPPASRSPFRYQRARGWLFAVAQVAARQASFRGVVAPREATPAPNRRLQACYDRRMSEVAARELRNRTADVLRRVAAGEPVTITNRGRPVAQLTAIPAVSHRPIARAELTRRLRRTQADSSLREDLSVLAGETTDDLDPIR